MKHSLVILPLALTLSSLTSAQAVNAKPENNSAAERNTANTTERNKALVLKWSDLFRGNNKDLAAAQALVTDDWVIHGTGVNLPRGPEGLKQWQGYIDAMWFVPRPPATEDIFAEGDRVVRRSTVFRTLKSNNKESAMTVVFIYRIAGSKIAEVWRVADGLYSYQQVGAQIIMPGTNTNADRAASEPAKPGTATFAAAELFYFAPTLLLRGGGYLKSFSPDQLNTLALLSLNLFGLGAVIFTVFYGLGWTWIGGHESAQTGSVVSCAEVV